MTLIVSPAARQDLLDISAYITDDLHNPIAARNVVQKIARLVNQLKRFPELGAGLPQADGTADYRHIVVESYLVIYKSTGTDVTVTRIFYAKSDYLQLLRG